MPRLTRPSPACRLAPNLLTKHLQQDSSQEASDWPARRIGARAARSHSLSPTTLRVTWGSLG